MKTIFHLDSRGLAYFRILLGCVICVKILQIFPNLGLLYTDKGVLPLSLLHHASSTSSLFWTKLSFYHWVSSYPAVLALGILHFILAFLFLLGWHTRWITPALWFMTVSLNARNPLILNGGDSVITVFLFWAIFLPTANHFSWDACKRSSFRPPKPGISAFGSTCFILQLIIIYLLAGHAKSHSVWGIEFDALKYALMNDAYATSFGKNLLHFPLFLKSLTATTLYLEQFIVLLLLFPYYSPVFRTIIPIIFIMFHLGIALTLDVGLFPYACIAAWVALFPTSVYDWILRVFFKSRRESKIAHAQPAQNALPFILGIGTMGYLVLVSNLTQEKGIFQRINTFPAHTLKLRQRWRLYAPTPSFSTKWFAIQITHKDGKETCLYPFHKELLPATSNHTIPDQYPIFYLRKYFYLLQRTNKAELYEACIRGFLNDCYGDKQPDISKVKLICWQRPYYPEWNEDFSHWTIYDNIHKSPKKYPPHHLNSTDDQEVD